MLTPSDLGTVLRRRWLTSANVGESLAELEEEGPTDGDSRAEYLFALARLAEEVWSNRRWVVDVYIHAWEANPRESRPLTRALQVALEMRRYEIVADVAALELRATTDDARRQQLRVLLGTTLLDLGRREEASPLLSAALLAAPEDEGIQTLASICHDDLDWSEEVVRLVAQVQRSPRDVAAALCLRVARILSLERPGGPAYEKLLARAVAYEPVDDGAAYLYEQLLAENDRWEDLAAFHEQRVAAADGAEARARRLLGLAWRWHHGFAELERAAAYAERALELVGREGVVLPAAPAALVLLAEAWNARGAWEELCHFIDGLFERSLPADLEVEAARVAAKIAWRRLADEPRALAYLQRVERRVPDSALLRAFDCRHPRAARVEDAEAPDDPHPDKAIDGWRKAVAADPSARLPRRRLAAALRRAARWNGLIEALREEAGVVASDEERAALQFQIADVYLRELRLEAMAAGTLQRVLELETLPPPMLDELLALHQRADRFSDVAAVLARQGREAKSDEERVRLGLAQARVLDRLHQETQAIPVLEEVLSLEPGQPEAIARLLDLYEKRHVWDKLVALRRTLVADEPDPAARLTGAVEVARLAGRVRQAEVRVRAWQDVLQLAPDHAEALAELEKLHERRGDKVAMADIVERRAEATTDEKERLALFERAAQLYADRAPDRSILAWRRVLAASSEHVRARDAIKRLCIATRAWDDLEAVYITIGRPEEYMRLLERQVESETSPETQADLAVRLASFHLDVLSRPDRGRAVLEWVLELNPTHAGAARRLIPIYEAAGDTGKLAAMIEAERAALGDPRARAERAARLAALAETTFGDRAAALRWRLAAFEDEPTAQARVAEAERVAALENAWRDLADAYRRAAAKVERAHAVPLLERLAALEERELHDLEAAAATWGSLIVADPAHAGALDAIERVYAVLRRAPDGDAARGMTAAFEAYAQLLRETPGDRATMDRLERLAEATQAWPALAQLYRDLASGKLERDAQIEVRCRLGRAYGEKLGEVERAIATFTRILDLEAGNEQAANALEDLYRRAHRYREAFELRLKQAAKVPDPQARARALFEAGVVARDHLNLRNDALRCFEQAEKIYLDAGDRIGSGEFLKVFHAIDALLTAEKDWQSMVGRYRRIISRIGKRDGDMFLLTLWYSLAEMCTKNADPAGAAHASKEAARLERTVNVATGTLDLQLGSDD